MFLLAWKLKETKSPKEPIRRPFQRAAEGLGRVLDHAQAGGCCAMRVEPVAVDRQPREVDRDDGARARA